MEQVSRQLDAARTSHKKVRFSITQTELNEYLAYELQQSNRPGVRSIALELADGNDVSLATRIDIDEVARNRPGLIPPLLQAILHGVKTIQAETRFRAERGGLTFQVQKASIDGFPLPAGVVQKIIEEVASRQPEHYDLTRPVTLPNGVQRVTTRLRLLEGEN